MLAYLYIKIIKPKIIFFKLKNKKLIVLLNSQTKRRIVRKMNRIHKNKNIDKEYNVFSATQSNNVDTEINTLNQIIESKKKQIDDINKKKQEIIYKLEDIKQLNYKNVLGKEPVENIHDKLILIRKFMDIDLHRAKMEMDKLLKLF